MSARPWRWRGCSPTCRREKGTAVLLVEHDLDLVRRAVTRLHVLDFGRTIATGTCADVLRDEAVITAYLGVAAT